MSIETIFRVIVQTIISKNNSYGSIQIRNNFGYILNYIDKWNPNLFIHECSISTKLFQFYYNNKEFGCCHNPKCNKIFTNVRSFHSGYPVCCSYNCRNEYLKVKMSGSRNPNYGHQWSDEQKLVASKRTSNQMKNPYYRYVANQPKTEASRVQKSKKISEGQKRFHATHPGIFICKRHFTSEQKKQIGIKSKQKFTTEFKERHRKTMESRGYWIRSEDKTDWQIYTKQANWICKMFDLITENSQIQLLKELGVFNAFTNTTGVVRDHIYSRNSGFINGVFPEILRHPCNCQIITHSDNVKKKVGRYTDADEQTLDELFSKIINYTGQWNEQEKCLNLIEQYKKGERWINPFKTL